MREALQTSKQGTTSTSTSVHCTQWRHRRRKVTYRSIPSVITSTIHGLGLVGWHGNTTHAMHAQSQTTKGNEHFRFTHCTRAGVLAPSEVIYTAFLYQGKAFFQVRVILFYSDLVCALWQRELQLQEHTHTHTQ